MRTIYPVAIVLLLAGGGYFLLEFIQTERAAERNRREQRPTPVVAYAAKPISLTDRLEAIGTARANESVEITANTQDLVEAIYFEDGDEVETGAKLVHLDEEQARAAVRSARVRLDEARQNLSRFEDLFADNVIPRSQLESQLSMVEDARADVETAEKRLEDVYITAPFAGRLGARQVSVGALVQPGAVITTLDDIDRIKLDFTTPERFLPVVRRGMTVEAKAAAYPDEIFTGVVTHVDPRVDPQTRALSIRAIIENEDHRLKPGMLLAVELIKGTEDVLLVPEQSVVPVGYSTFLFLIDPETNAVTKREVETGRRQPGVVEIRQGLRAGELLVVEGGVRIRDGDTVEIVELLETPEQTPRPIEDLTPAAANASDS